MIIRRCWWVGLLLALLVGLRSGRGDAQHAAVRPCLRPDGGRGRVVFLGTSLTAGYGLDPSQAYPALIQQKIDSAGLPFEASTPA